MLTLLSSDYDKNIIEYLLHLSQMTVVTIWHHEVHFQQISRVLEYLILTVYPTTVTLLLFLHQLKRETS